jgi:CheY-like chemotaxis protein
MPLLMLDPQRLRQIVFNLVGNAVKFTSKGHIEIRASFDRSAGGETGVCRIDVEDTGCGISDENLKHLGSAYVQVGEKLARNGGTGLGLAICRQLVHAMGGELKVSSTLGQGSVFSVVIPGVKAVPENAEAGGPAGTNGLAGAAGAGVSEPQSHPIKRILLVDDSKMNLLVLKALLNRLGNFEVAMAQNGQEALTRLQTPGAKSVDLVLTDMWMPEMDGAGLVKAIRAVPTLASLHVIAVTADTEFQGKVADLGFDGMLLKPVTMERLAGVLGVSK